MHIVLYPVEYYRIEVNQDQGKPDTLSIRGKTVHDSTKNTQRLDREWYMRYNDSNGGGKQ